MNSMFHIRVNVIKGGKKYLSPIHSTAIHPIMSVSNFNSLNKELLKIDRCFCKA
jgi:hypothetical protein